MICRFCRTAGRMLQEDLPTDPGLEGEIIILHNECTGGTWCDCQHKIGTYINRERTSDAK